MEGREEVTGWNQVGEGRAEFVRVSRVATAQNKHHDQQGNPAPDQEKQPHARPVITAPSQVRLVSRHHIMLFYTAQPKQSISLPSPTSQYRKAINHRRGIQQTNEPKQLQKRRPLIPQAISKPTRKPTQTPLFPTQFNNHHQQVDQIKSQTHPPPSPTQP